MPAGTSGQLNKQVFKQSKQTVQNGQSFQNKQFNFSKQFDFKQLKLTKMKKQLYSLILTLFVLSVFSSAAFAQLTPRPIECLPADHLHPIAGQPYNYTITVPTPPGAKTVRWMATQSTTFITGDAVVAVPEIAGVSDVLANAGVNYNNPTTDLFTMSLTWKYFAYDPTAPVFVIVNVVNADGTCSPNNLKVWKIMPINAFTLDIDNRLQDNSALHTGSVYGDEYQRCRDLISSAYYDPNTVNDPDDDGVVYDFGSDTLYFEVVSANWSGAWKPSLQVSGYAALQTITRVDWSNTSDFTTPNTTTLVGTDYVADGLVIPNAANGGANGSVGSAGQSIIVRVIIAHNNHEGIVADVIVTRVDGQLYFIDDPTITPPFTYTAAGVYDVHYANGTGTPCAPLVEDGFTNDLATQTLLPRPNVVEGAGIGNFLPIEP
jgi:hypothetical protein